MGMFDDLKLEYKIEDKDYQDVSFQTKSLNNCLDFYVINKDGNLFKLEYDMIEEKKKFKSKKKGFEGLIEELHNHKRVNERYVPYYFHGDIYFYGSSKELSHSLDLNFIARYSEGKLLYIYHATEEGQMIHKDKNNIEFLALEEFKDREFLKYNVSQITNFEVEDKKSNFFKKILLIFGIKKYIINRGILLSTYMIWLIKKRSTIREEIKEQEKPKVKKGKKK